MQFGIFITLLRHLIRDQTHREYTRFAFSLQCHIAGARATHNSVLRRVWQFSDPAAAAPTWLEFSPSVSPCSQPSRLRVSEYGVKLSWCPPGCSGRCDLFSGAQSLASMRRPQSSVDRPIRCGLMLLAVVVITHNVIPSHGFAYRATIRRPPLIKLAHIVRGWGNPHQPGAVAFEVQVVNRIKAAGVGNNRQSLL